LKQQTNLALITKWSIFQGNPFFNSAADNNRFSNRELLKMLRVLLDRRSGDAVSQLVARVNEYGLAALENKHGGGAQIIYGEAERKRILAELERQPDREKDGTATWSISSLQKALRAAPDGLAQVSGFTIWKVLQESGKSWQKTRSWKETGKARRKRKERYVDVVDADTEAKKSS
jgi:transposase